MVGDLGGDALYVSCWQLGSPCLHALNQSLFVATSSGKDASAEPGAPSNAGGEVRATRLKVRYLP